MNGGTKVIGCVGCRDLRCLVVAGFPCLRQLADVAAERSSAYIVIPECLYQESKNGYNKCRIESLFAETLVV